MAGSEESRRGCIGRIESEESSRGRAHAWTASSQEGAVRFVALLQQQKFRFGMAEDLQQEGLFVLAYASLKFQAEQKTEEVDNLVNQLN